MWNPIAYGENVRTQTKRGTKDTQDYEVVEERQGFMWVERARFGHMSDSSALSEASNCARELARKYIGGH